MRKGGAGILNGIPKTKNEGESNAKMHLVLTLIVLL